MTNVTKTITLALVLGSTSLLAADRQAAMPTKHAAVFKTYCLDCHDPETKEGGVDLQNISFAISQDIATAELWQKILNAINAGEMPPEDAEPLSDGDKTAFLDDLSTQMVTARRILSDSGGVITMRRLNRREYANTIEVLLGVRPNVSTFPDDQATAGFDTSGASLFFSSDQLEQYLATAKGTLELALLPRTPRESKTVRIEPEEEYTPHYAAAAARMKDTSTRARAFLAQSEKPASEFGLLDAYQAKKQQVAEWLPLMENYLARPETKTGITLIMTIKEGGYTKVKLPVLSEFAEGKYMIRVRAAAYPDAAERLHYLEFTSGYGTGRTLLGWRKVTAPLDDPQIIEFPIEHQPGEKLQIWIHQRSHQDRGDKNLATIDMKENGLGTPPGLWIDWAELEGPELVSRKTLAASELNNAIETLEAGRKPAAGGAPLTSDETEVARKILHRFASRAFRGEEPSSELLDRLVQQYAANRATMQTPTEALIGPLSIILASPSFLYMVESAGNEDSPSLTGTELAVRLSYFLWSEPPDDELMKAARSGQLADRRGLFQQTSRLLADPRVDRFVRGFVHQWLQMERLGMFQFDGVQFPTFDNAVRECAREEMFQTVHAMLDEKLPLKNLLRSDYVVVNDIMADYYGLSLTSEPAALAADRTAENPGAGTDGSRDGSEGHAFRKVKVPEGSLRGGLLGTAAVLAMGSDGLRSSPVERGVWVLRHLINDPPPPAPPNVPQLSRLAGEVLSARELAQAHQEQPQCAQCHRKIDPIGFALENFDAAGLWRDVESISIGKRKGERVKEFAIDSRGRLPGGEQFADYFGLRDAVAGHVDDFARGLTEALIAYGLGRPYGFTDQDLADEIIGITKPRNYELSIFVHALVQSKQFQNK